MFARESLLNAGWYAARLAAKQRFDQKLWRRHVEYLDKFLKRPNYADEAARLNIATRLDAARNTLAQVESPVYLEFLRGTLGAEPIEAYLTDQHGIAKT